MARSDPHETETLIRYAEDALSAEERAQIDAHLLLCEPCREYLTFMREFNAGLRSAKPQESGPNEPHPDASLIVALASDALDQAAAREVRAHLVFCDECSDEFFLLQRFAREQEVAAPWRRRIEQLGETLLDLGKSYGVGAVLGPFRIVAETPAFALRGGAAVDKTSKSIEVKIGENTYGVEFHVSQDGRIFCDIAGFRTPVKSPVEANMFSEGGEKLAATRTDKFGNGRIALPPDGPPSDCWLLTLACGAAEQQILFRAPQP